MKKSAKYMIWSLVIMAISFASLLVMTNVFGIGTKTSTMNKNEQYFYIFMFFIVPLFVSLKLADEVTKNYRKENENVND